MTDTEASAQPARDVVVQALNQHHQELSGEAAPLDFDGARKVLRALAAAGFVVIQPTDPEVIERVTTAVRETAGRRPYADVAKAALAACRDRPGRGARTDLTS